MVDLIEINVNYICAQQRHSLWSSSPCHVLPNILSQFISTKLIKTPCWPLTYPRIVVDMKKLTEIEQICRISSFD